MASGDVSPSKFPCPIRTKIIEQNVDTARTLVEEKPDLYFRGVNSNEPVYTVPVDRFIAVVSLV